MTCSWLFKYQFDQTKLFILKWMTWLLKFCLVFEWKATFIQELFHRIWGWSILITSWRKKLCQSALSQASAMEIFMKSMCGTKWVAKRSESKWNFGNNEMKWLRFREVNIEQNMTWNFTTLVNLIGLMTHWLARTRIRHHHWWHIAECCQDSYVCYSLCDRSGAWTIWTMLRQSFHWQPTTCSLDSKDTVTKWGISVCFPLIIINRISIFGIRSCFMFAKLLLLFFIGLLVLCLLVSLVFRVFSSLCCLAGCFSMCTLLTDRLIDWLIDWLIHWFIGWWVGALVDWLFGWYSPCSLAVMFRQLLMLPWSIDV